MTHRPAKGHGPVPKHRTIKVGGPIDQSNVSIRIFGPSLDPAAITRLLKCRPTKAGMKGARRPRRPAAKEGFWFLSSEERGKDRLERQLLKLLKRVPASGKVWAELNRRYHADVFCGVFLDEWNRGFELSSALLKELSKRHLKIGFDIYGP